MFCNFCGKKIANNAVICPKCGAQVNQFNNGPQGGPRPVNNYYTTNNNVPYGPKPKSKWVALLLCLFTVFGHKFYEGKILMGFVYIFTVGLFGIGWLIDIFILLFKPNPYYV